MFRISILKTWITFYYYYYFHVLCVRPEDHISRDQDEFQRNYVSHLRQKLRFHPGVETRVKKTLKQIAKHKKLQPKDVTYVGIHNRRTDHLEYVSTHLGFEPIEADYFIDAMEYFR